MDEQANLVRQRWVNFSQLCLTGFQVLQQAWVQGQEAGAVAVCCDSIQLSRCLVQQAPNFKCAHLVMGDQDRSGIRWVYCPPSSTSLFHQLLEKALNQRLDSVKGWMWANKLKLNKDKTELLPSQ